MAKVAKLMTPVVTLRELAERIGISREATHQIIKKAGIDVESPCSRCGTSTTLLKFSDANKIEKARAKSEAGK